MTVDESPWSINDACLGVSAEVAKIVDWPATFHNNACGFSYCDGHAEVQQMAHGPHDAHGAGQHPAGFGAYAS